MAWVLAALGIFVGFIALYYANEAKSSVEKRLKEFTSSTVSKFEAETGELDKRINNNSVSINEQLNKLRIRDESMREEIIETKKQLSNLHAELKNLDSRILPKYKR